MQKELGATECRYSLFMGDLVYIFVFAYLLFFAVGLVKILFMGDLICFFICVYGMGCSAGLIGLCCYSGDIYQWIYAVILLVLSVVGTIGSFYIWFDEIKKKAGKK